MNAEELRDTTLDPANRTLIQVSMRDAGAADDMFRILMGDKVEPRREFIEKTRPGPPQPGRVIRAAVAWDSHPEPRSLGLSAIGSGGAGKSASSAASGGVYRITTGTLASCQVAIRSPSACRSMETT